MHEWELTTPNSTPHSIREPQNAFILFLQLTCCHAPRNFSNHQHKLGANLSLLILGIWHVSHLLGSFTFLGNYVHVSFSWTLIPCLGVVGLAFIENKGIKSSALVLYWLLYGIYNSLALDKFMTINLRRIEFINYGWFWYITVSKSLY